MQTSMEPWKYNRYVDDEKNKKIRELSDALLRAEHYDEKYPLKKRKSIVEKLDFFYYLGSFIIGIIAFFFGLGISERMFVGIVFLIASAITIHIIRVKMDGKIEKEYEENMRTRFLLRSKEISKIKAEIKKCEEEAIMQKEEYYNEYIKNSENN